MTFFINKLIPDTHHGLITQTESSDTSFYSLSQTAPPPALSVCQVLLFIIFMTIKENHSETTNLPLSEMLKKHKN